MKNLMFISILLFLQITTAQISISGQVKSSDGKPLESATVYLTKAKDSTMINYSITDSKGLFKLNIKRQEEPFSLKISFVGFKNYQKIFKYLNESENLYEIILEDSQQLDEITIKSEAPPIRIKKDTLEFNASSFKVTPDANVETLLKQLPGVEIDEEGNITVNGKPVNNILVNGKPFFGKDGKIATKNLLADMIDKVQVTDTKTKEEELSGKSASSNESTINLTLQEGKDKGWFGKATAGYGTDKRYESNILLNYFKGKQRVNLLGSSNNINSVGFSFDEIFDNMIGGRANSIYMSDNGTFGFDDMRFGSDTGITKSYLGGFNFSDSWFKGKLDPYTNYIYTQSDTDNLNNTEQINFLPTGNTKTSSNNESFNQVIGHQFNNELSFKIDSLTTISLNPNFSKAIENSTSRGNRFTKNENGDLLNENFQENFQENESNSFQNKLIFSRRFKKKGRFISAGVENKNRENDNFSQAINNSSFFQNGLVIDNRNQQIFNLIQNDEYIFKAEYAEPIHDSLSIGLGGSYKINKGKTDFKTLDFNQSQNNYNLINDLQTYLINRNENMFNLETNLNYNSKKSHFSISVGLDFLSYDHNSLYQNNLYTANKKHIFPKVNGYYSKEFSKKLRLYSSFSYDASLPQAFQLLPFENLSNPLNTIKGNLNLRPEEKYGMYFGLNNYDWETRTGFFSYMGVNYTNQAIVSSTVFDESFKSTTTFENVNHFLNTYGGLSYSKSFKKDKRNLKLSVSLNGNYQYNQGLTNNVLFSARQYNFGPRISINYAIEQLITIVPSYSYSLNKAFFENYIIENTSNNSHEAKLELTTYWPKKVVFGTDLSYRYNSDIAPGFRNDFYMLNMSLGYNFFKDQLLVKVKVYDLLNQNLNAIRRITPTAIVDSQNLVLQRYFMFSLTYKFNQMGKDEKKSMMFFD